MPPINSPEFLEMQKLGRQLGELRFGKPKTDSDGSIVLSKNGRPIPEKLETWRITTRSSFLAADVAEKFDKPHKKVTLANGQQTFEVMTKVDRLDVVIPPGAAAIDQWMELWSGGGCQRRCDRVQIRETGEACKCPADDAKRQELAKQGKACKMVTRAWVMLPDLPGLGVWRIVSNGFHAAVELGGDTQRLAAAAAQGIYLPAAAVLDPRTDVKNGQTRKFVVPYLEIKPSIRQILEIEASGRGTLVDALPGGSLAIESGSPIQVRPEPAKALPHGDDDTDVIDAELVEDPDAPSSADAMHPQEQTGQAEPADAPATGRASVKALAAVNARRETVGMDDRAWMKFAAMTLKRGIKPAEANFTAAEIDQLNAALDLEERKAG